MAKYLATNRNRPCPICEKTNGNCRVMENDLILCMTFADGYGAENHPDYRYTKPTKDGMWGIYAPRSDNDFDRDRWLREKETRQVKQTKTNQTALPIEVRNRDIKTILGQLSLNDGDRRALYRRGFTDGDIEKLGYKSVKQWQPLEGEISYAVNRRGNLNNPTDGVIIPIPYFGQYQALRLHNPQGRPKYRSFKGTNLKSGEFPVAVYGHELAKGITWVTEGLEFKPALTYLRLQVPVIGHNGSNFTSSKNQVKESLKRLNTETVIMAPDGGVVVNPSLVIQYRTAIAFYQSLGYTVKIAWWGQFTKADGDIDELTDPSRIQYISPEKFLSYCQDSKLNRFDIEKFKQEKERKYKELQKFTPDIIIKDRISNYSPTELKNILLENGVKLSGEGTLDGITLHVKAPTGAGKTQQLLATLKEFYWTVGVGLLGYRNGLLEQTKERADNAFVHIHYDKKEFNDLDNSLWLSTCVNSILKVDIDWWKGKIIVLDEIVAILEYLVFSKTLEQNRAEIIERFIYALKVSRGVICLDGHNADFIGNFFTGLTDKPVVKLLNDYAIPRPDIKFLEGTIKNQKLRKNDKSPFLKHIKETIAHNPIGVTSDSKIFLKSLTEILESLGYKCLLITSETKSKKAVKDFIANPDKALLENKYDAILYSPSAESGLSIDIKGYFKAFYAFFFGVLGTNAQQQMIIRVRDVECPRYVWLRSHSIVTDSTFERRFDDVALLRSLLTSEVNQLTLENPDQVLATITEKIENFPHQLRGLAENFRLIAQYERINFREAFCNAVTENGYPLERVILESDKQSKQELKAKTNAIKDRESAEIFNASDKFLYSTLPILGENATDADRAALKKAKILTDLPNLECEDLWSPEFVRFLEFDRVMTLSHRRRYVMAHNLELAQKISNRRYQRYTQKNGLCPWDLKTEYLQSKAIVGSGILELITFLINNPSASLTADHPMVKGIIQKCKKATIYKALGRSPGQQPMRFISWLLNLLGYRLKEHNYKTPDGKKHREYLLNYDDLVETSPYFEVIDRLLTIRFERAVLAPESSTIPENSLENESLKNDYVDTPQSYTEQGFESVPDSSDKFEKSEDHLEPIQEPITVESSTTTSTNQRFKVGDRVAYLKFGELKSATIQSLKDVSDMGAKLSASMAVLDDGVSISVRNLQAIA